MRKSLMPNRSWLILYCRGPGSVPGQETEIPQAAWSGQNKKNKTRSWLILNVPVAKSPTIKSSRKMALTPYFKRDHYLPSHQGSFEEFGLEPLQRRLNARV